MLKSKNAGFTIVELLIVIVVIGILAAITIVSFNGVQNRAKDAAQVTAVSQWESIIKLYVAQHGSVPLSTPPTTADPHYFCLAESYPSKDVFQANRCRYVQIGPDSSQHGEIDSGLISSLKEVGGIPKVPDAGMGASGAANGTPIKMLHRGIALVVENTPVVYKLVYGVASESCPGGDEAEVNYSELGPDESVTGNLCYRTIEL